MVGKPAARLGDMTTHGTPLSPGPGSMDVFIGGKPAWRAVQDMHSCPMFNGPVPHVGGVVTIASTTVFINNMPAVRLGDQVMEGAGGPNAIVSGEFTVFIG
jgi:uncharacterized Zn-binding protein involved in type VI secretion